MFLFFFPLLLSRSYSYSPYFPTLLPFLLPFLLLLPLLHHDYTAILTCKRCSLDRGGITSHAAIVAREMQKPCIIGTKVATQVLKDGDLVEVDADNGVVRILEKA